MEIQFQDKMAEAIREGRQVIPGYFSPDIFKSLYLTPPGRTRAIILTSEIPSLGYTGLPSGGSSSARRNIAAAVEANTFEQYSGMESWARQGILVLPLAFASPSAQVDWEPLLAAILLELYHGDEYPPTILSTWGKRAEQVAARYIDLGDIWHLPAPHPRRAEFRETKIFREINNIFSFWPKADTEIKWGE